VIVKTGRFGQLTVGDDEKIRIPQGVLGFPEFTEFCLVDPADDTLILWLQSTQSPEYSARLSAAELRELKLENINQSAVFSILTISDDVAQMTANLKAPLVINLKEQVAKQVVLQENEYSIKHPMFKELRAHLITISAQRSAPRAETESAPVGSAITIRDIPPSLTVKSLQA